MTSRTFAAALLACLAVACSGRESGAAAGGGAGGADSGSAAEPGAPSGGGSDARAAPGRVISPLRALGGVPILTGSDEVERSGTPEAMQVVYLVAISRDSVAAAYRRVLPQRGWRIKGDVTDHGVVQLYAERMGPPLWIRIQDAGPGAAQYTIIGAQASDTARTRDSSALAPRVPVRPRPVPPPANPR